MTERKCDNCKFAVLKDIGYSNYTVEGYYFTCAKDAHPDGSFDQFYGENPKFEFAKQCEFYEAGDPVALDVDGEYEPTAAEQEILNIQRLHNLIKNKE